VLIAFAGRVLPARGTRKVHTRRWRRSVRSSAQQPSAKSSTARWSITATPRRPNPLPRPSSKFDHTRVDLVEMYPGADDALMRAAVAAGAGGIVLAGTGIGNANPVVVDAARAIVAGGVAVVLSTRVPEGPVAGVYGDGGGADLVAAGIPAASGLPATQLRMLLALWLSQHEVGRQDQVNDRLLRG
jgi:L-asparaginase